MSAQSRQRTYTQYVKPEASDGLDKFRVFLSTDVNTMKRLPKYDFANVKLNITPGSHGFMEKTICYSKLKIFTTFYMCLSKRIPEICSCKILLTAVDIVA